MTSCQKEVPTPCTGESKEPSEVKPSLLGPTPSSKEYHHFITLGHASHCKKYVNQCVDFNTPVGSVPQQGTTHLLRSASPAVKILETSEEKTSGYRVEANPLNNQDETTSLHGEDEYPLNNQEETTSLHWKEASTRNNQEETTSSHGEEASTPSNQVDNYNFS